MEGLIFVHMSLKISKITVSVRSLVKVFSLRGYLRGYMHVSRNWKSTIEGARSIWGSEGTVFWERTSTCSC